MLNFMYKKGQSTVEYIIVIAAVLSILIAFFKPGGIFESSFTTSLNSTANGMKEMAGRMSMTTTTRFMSGDVNGTP